MDTNPLIGKTIESVWLAEDGKAIRFNLKGGEEIIARTEGDCCSSTWIESIEMPENMIGTVREADDIDMNRASEKADYEIIQFYGFRIVTEKGIATLDYRNESNGYYGGSLDWPRTDGKESYFYGGVFGQNISSVFTGGKWNKIA